MEWSFGHPLISLNLAFGHIFFEIQTQNIRRLSAILRFISCCKKKWKGTKLFQKILENFLRTFVLNENKYFPNINYIFLLSLKELKNHDDSNDLDKFNLWSQFEFWKTTLFNLNMQRFFKTSKNKFQVFR